MFSLSENNETGLSSCLCDVKGYQTGDMFNVTKFEILLAHGILLFLFKKLPLEYFKSRSKFKILSFGCDPKLHLVFITNRVLLTTCGPEKGNENMDPRHFLYYLFKNIFLI